MEILGKALYLLLIIVFMRFFYFVLKKSFEDKNSTTVKMVTRGRCFIYLYNSDSFTICYSDFYPKCGYDKKDNSRIYRNSYVNIF